MSDAERAAGFLEALVSAYSPSGEEDEAAQVLTGHLEALGLATHRDAAGNVHARRDDLASDAPTILLLGHVDTVPGQLDVAWQDGTLTGRGTVDAKGPLVAHALALAHLPEELPLDVRLVAAVGEEATSRGARHLRETLDPPDGLVIAEPTGRSTIGLGYKGRVTARLTATAKPAHAGHPAPTASEQLLKGLDALTRWTGNPARDPGLDATTLRVRDLDAEPGATLDRASATLDLRIPGDPPEPAQLEAALPERIELEVTERVPAVHADPRNPIATALRGALLAEGTRPRPARKTGTSDWNVVHDVWPAPGVAYGPGDPALDHTPDEAIALTDVLQASRVLADALQRAARMDAFDRARPSPEPTESSC